MSSFLRGARSIQPSNAPERHDLTQPGRVRVTHPFHPLAGQEFTFVKRRKCWHQDRVFVIDTGGELMNLPAEWTDVVAQDPFVVVAAGRAPFHLAGLAAAADRVVQLRAARTESVKETSP